MARASVRRGGDDLGAHRPADGRVGREEGGRAVQRTGRRVVDAARGVDGDQCGDRRAVLEEHGWPSRCPRRAAPPRRPLPRRRSPRRPPPVAGPAPPVPSPRSRTPARADGRRSRPDRGRRGRPSGTIGTTWCGIRPHGEADAVLLQPRHHPVGGRQPVGAAPGQADGVGVGDQVAGSRASVSRVPGPPPRTSTAAIVAGGGSTTVVPVLHPRPIRWWWPTRIPATSVRSFRGPDPTFRADPAVGVRRDRP